MLLRKILESKGILPGIRVDKGVAPLFGRAGEFISTGLSDLGTRCAQYKKDGCHFAKWRCVYRITKNTPSYQALRENAVILARYAAICQEHSIVPIVEPEVLPQGSHPIQQCLRVTEKVLSFLYRKLHDYHIYLEGKYYYHIIFNTAVGSIRCLFHLIHKSTMENISAKKKNVPNFQGYIILLHHFLLYKVVV